MIYRPQILCQDIPKPRIIIMGRAFPPRLIGQRLCVSIRLALERAPYPMLVSAPLPTAAVGLLRARLFRAVIRPHEKSCARMRAPFVSLTRYREYPPRHYTAHGCAGEHLSCYTILSGGARSQCVLRFNRQNVIPALTMRSLYSIIEECKSNRPQCQLPQRRTMHSARRSGTLSA